MAVELQSTEVVAVVVTVNDDSPQVLTVGAPGGIPAVPSGPLLADHRSLQAGLRDWVTSQTGLHPGYVEQLYTFADRERAGSHTRMISVSYLGLTRAATPDGGSAWRNWYDLFPWEDRRDDNGIQRSHHLVQQLHGWADCGASDAVRHSRSERIAATFGQASRPWRPEDCLHRYELLWEAGLLAESRAHGSGRPAATPGHVPTTGTRMRHDHRRIVATGMARLRAKIQYRPVIFELMPPTFTLGQLQNVVEALTGTRLHKQNFRRLVAQEDLVEETGERTTDTGGRPAKLMRFRADVLSERPSTGLRLPQSRPR
ncbi:hypothetical protein KEM60_02412 [Austwickia sp. TVS 96-490-7B]|uniref:NUDIX hydrolase n=1 Tax=Austwickia sp. TVS 96-490-7B TaxID=2830843 RepID=UPI001C5686D0|nr:hypothetical protein [Austwickia sp. TVS 96-490-7B]MBW3086201.1 hypothetical protein [Austwickia sp. TVS 96-490-7B]